ncbi:MAG: hypothetical protein GF347_04275 [Candidatus Moranbacteria bacterium]|nr:hypothetical protein [Candidatus Moranbacteria bacterium]
MDFSSGDKLAKKEENKKEGSSWVLLLGLFFLVLLIGGGVYYAVDQGFLFGTSEVTTTRTVPSVTTRTETKEGLNIRERQLTGKKVGNLMLPEKLDEDAVGFLSSLESQDEEEIPIQVSPEEKGKENPFLR